MKATRVFLVLAGVVLAALPAFGQLPVATVTGQVTTAENAPLPGVTVTVSSPSLQGTRSTTSGENGSYLIGLLPPGDYQVTFEMQGFAGAEKSVKLSAAQTTTLDQEMVLEGVTEEIVVTGSYETISAGGQASTTYNYKEVIEKLPVNRNIVDAVLLTSGVAPTGPGRNISISGSQSHENLFLVNGVVVTENLRGQPFDLFIEDAIEETTTSTSAVSAEFGRFAGGVVNTITKSGGNELSGSFRSNLTNDDWIARSDRRTSTGNQLSPVREDEINETYEATLGGWLWRDRAWYFLAGRDLERTLTKTTGQVRVFNGATTPGIPFPEGREQERYEGKLTLSPFQGHRLTASYMEIDDLELGNRFIANVLDLASLNSRETPQELRALNYNGVLTENFFVEAQYSEREFTFIGSGSRFTDRILGTLFVDQPTAARWHSPTFCGVCRPEERDNENLLAKASYFLTTESLGSHDLVVGYDTFSDIRAADNHQSGSDFRILLSGTIFTGGELFPVFDFEDPNNPLRRNRGTIIQYNPILVSSKGTDFTTNSIFLNDRWRLNDHWSFNLGVRYDENDGVNGQGQEVASDSKVSPRLGVTWDPKGDGDWLFNASYGHYVAALANTQGDSTSLGGNPAAFQWWYRGPAINTGTGALIPADTALQMLWDWFDAQGGVNNTSNIRLVDIPGGTTVIGGGSLDSPHTIEYTIGATKRLGGKGLVRADLVHRDAQDFYVGRVDLQTGSVTTPTGGRANLEVVENDDSVLEREYNGLHTQFQYRFTDKLNVGGVYTLSEAKGNWEGEIGTSGPIRSDVLAFPEYKELEWNAPIGSLSIDQRHRLRLFGTYDVFRTEHHSLNVGLLQVFTSGTPYGAQAPIPGNFITNPGYAIQPATVTYFFTDRDAFHTDEIKSTNLSLNYGFTFGALGKEIEIFIQPEVLNLFNEDGAEVVNQSVFTAANRAFVCPNFAATCAISQRTVLRPFNPFTTTPIEGFAGTPGDAHFVKGPDFGRPTIEDNLQTPRTYRVSVGFRF